MRPRSDHHDSLPVMVPRSKKRLSPMSPQRILQLRQHLTDIMRDLKKSRLTKSGTPAAPPQPDGFAGVVANAACALCKGLCCNQGDDHGFINDKALARVRHLHPKLPDEDVVMMYLDRIPSTSYRGSCIFHGKKGCTLDRDMRSDICNNYFCGGLRAYIDSGAPPEPTIIIAGDTEKMRVSSVLSPGTD